MSDIIDKLNSPDEQVTNLELLDHVIAFQLGKIENYHAKNSQHASRTISDKDENSMSNLIELLKLREHYKHRK